MPTLHGIMTTETIAPFMHEKFMLPQNIDIESLDYSAIEHYRFILKELDKLGNQFLWMFDYSKNCFYYISENSIFFPKREFAFALGKGYQCLIDNTHPDDAPYMLEIQKKAFQFYKRLKTG